MMELIKAAGHYLIWLPTYSPDLNSIEKFWSRIKSIRNKLKIQNIDALFKIHCNEVFRTRQRTVQAVCPNTSEHALRFHSQHSVEPDLF